MTREVEAGKCRCGLLMVELGEASIGVCPNCDLPQPQQFKVNPRTGAPFDRVVTDRDRAYRKAMEKLEEEWYPKKKGGE